MAAVLTFGETMALVRATEIGGWETASAAHISVGGADSNVAIGLARLGVPVAWIGRVGDDPLGRRVDREIRAEGVLTTSIVDDHHPTGLMLKEQRTPVHTRVSFYRAGSAGSALRAEDIGDDAIAAAEIVLVNGVTAALSPTARAAVLSVAARARTFGTEVVFDVNHRPSLWRGRDPLPTYLEIAECADVLFAGEDEARLLLATEGGSAADLARALARSGPAEIIVKSGADGATGLSDGQLRHVRAVPIVPVDTVGAGDAFVAGYLAARLRGATLEERLSLGARCGAFACMGPGDWESLPRTADIALLGAADPVER
ncbi:sugar kinase [Microbacterium sp. NPDC090007]|uniref:sugar kinase n=1 Tax=Microbacterium sp. NPDC090007 TaxID=3364204 RepID=UPI003830DFE6